MANNILHPAQAAYRQGNRQTGAGTRQGVLGRNLQNKMQTRGIDAQSALAQANARLQRYMQGRGIRSQEGMHQGGINAAMEQLMAQLGQQQSQYDTTMSWEQKKWDEEQSHQLRNALLGILGSVGGSAIGAAGGYMGDIKMADAYGRR